MTALRGPVHHITVIPTVIPIIELVDEAEQKALVAKRLTILKTAPQA